MAYQVLARKWRPKTFADLVGQEHVVKALKNALDKGRLHHAYLLTGTRGVGKTTIARILAKSLNCEHAHNGEPCGQCTSCMQIDSGRYVDLLEIDAASNTGIDNIREVLENAQYAPTVGKYKVYIIDEVHMLSKSAFNAMLKTLEEPPEHVKFILATTDPHKVPITVLSRCLQFVLRNMTTQQVAEHLAYVLTQEQIPFEAPALQLLGRAAMGSMRDALSLLDQAIAMGSGKVTELDVRQMIGAVDKRYLYELLQYIVNQDGEALVAKAQEMAARAIGFDSALSELAILLQRLALVKTVPEALAEDPEYQILSRLAHYLGAEQIQLYYQCAIHGKQDLSLAPDEYAGFVMTLLRMLAFTPFAAKDHNSDGVIEGTQLHSTKGRDDTEKKLLTLPEQSTSAESLSGGLVETETKAPSGENETVVQEISVEVPKPTVDLIQPPAITAEKEDTKQLSQNDIPPWEELPITEPLPTEYQTYETSLAQHNGKLQPENNEYGNMPPERFEPAYAADILYADEYSHTETVRQSREEAFFDQEEEDSHIAYNETAASEALIKLVEDDEDDSVEDEPLFEPLPSFEQKNWAAIIRRLSTKLGAAQMTAYHTAWVRYDEERQLLILSMTDEGRATGNKERLDKIRNVLADAYGMVLQLQTEPWRDDQGWETPAMRRKRLQIEGRQHAKTLLEADEAAQNILNLFSAQWREDTLVLVGQDS
ncbi:DNA polymerase III subunits gamma and tau [Neisseria arctica]|uniref:DNA polymerase III subunit gamma/tau n=1 Tax=Neisseria arctica TaxID=1470200 RepID=A0A0J0YQK0_9NEIS|nr:DNA polymerase III subunit gamma/tau [Neisseria arctica]KLT72395.1 DNA polymerase III subunits gamma and tau [Neisseria arctica]UOO86031.1 DNA polymerase III subunit gamma/tau [Neisseria arctica]